jgi:hypothetical protein
MRRIVAALVIATLAVTLVGCGGGAEETATTEETPPATAAPAATAVDVEDRSANDYDLAPAAFPSFTTTSTPAVFQEKLDAHRAMLILFYDDKQQVTKDLRAEVDAVMGEYRGLIDFITFGVSGDANDPAVLAAVQYASELGAHTTPYVLIVDKSGFITWRNKGFAERGVLEREVERATR